MLSYFKAETNARGANEWHGNSGPITVKQSRLDLPICEAFLAAPGEAGLPVVDDRNADIAEGFGRIDTNIANLKDSVTNLTQAQSQIRDADFAAETAALTRAQVLVQSGTQVLAIANQQPQNVLALLRNL